MSDTDASVHCSTMALKCFQRSLAATALFYDVIGVDFYLEVLLQTSSDFYNVFNRGNCASFISWANVGFPRNW